jgi:hypothetical protein
MPSPRPRRFYSNSRFLPITTMLAKKRNVVHTWNYEDNTIPHEVDVKLKKRTYEAARYRISLIILETNGIKLKNIRLPWSQNMARKRSNTGRLRIVFLP